jgi:hypothetical protein
MSKYSKRHFAVLRKHGHAEVVSDIVDHGFPLQFVGDVLTQTKMAFGTEAIVTNPPYRLVEEFVARALELAPLGSCCCASLFLSARRRLEGRGLKRVQVFPNRLAPRRLERLQSLRLPGSSGRAGIAVQLKTASPGRAHHEPAQNLRELYAKPTAIPATAGETGPAVSGKSQHEET